MKINKYENNKSSGMVETISKTRVQADTLGTCDSVIGLNQLGGICDKMEENYTNFRITPSVLNRLTPGENL